MKIFSLLLAAILLTGCSSGYVIETLDGRVFATQDDPLFTRGGYEFTDTEGNPRFLQLVQVRSLKSGR